MILTSHVLTILNSHLTGGLCTHFLIIFKTNNTKINESLTQV